jgi:hypothetical protein
MRPSTRRTDFGSLDPIGEYALANGRTVALVWLPINQTHSHVVAWIVGSAQEPKVVPNVARFNAGVTSERLLQALEQPTAEP